MDGYDGMAFLGYQERKKKLMGKDYVPPIYLD